MRRRDFIISLASASLSIIWPRRLAAQPGKVWRIGILETSSPALNAANYGALRKGLRDLGYVEGQNLVIDYRSADGRNELFPEFAAEIVRLHVDLIVTRGTPAVEAAKNATATIPIVMAASGDPLGTGIISGLARPGGNVTGLSAVSSELLGKRLEMLREAIAGLARIAFMHNLDNPVTRRQWDEFQSAGRSLRFEPLLLDVRGTADIERAFEVGIARGADAIVVGNDTVTHKNRTLIVELAAKRRLPAAYLSREFVDAGGLMTYGPNYPDLYRRAATLIDRIFKGVKPADLPIEQPTKFELIINLKTAKALGLAIPESFLVRADEVIE